MKTMHSALAAATLMTASVLPAADTPDLKVLAAQADGGDAAAQLALAVSYRDGKGITKDDGLALQWAHRAADRGNTDAMDFVGHAYLRGNTPAAAPAIRSTSVVTSRRRTSGEPTPTPAPARHRQSPPASRHGTPA